MASTTEQDAGAPAPRQWTITVPWDPNVLSLNRRLHHMARARITKAGREAGWTSWLLAGRPVASRRVIVSAYVYRGRLIDQDNAWAGLKPILDGIFSKKWGAGMTPDDSQEWVRLGSLLVVSGEISKGAEHVVLTITEEG